MGSLCCESLLFSCAHNNHNYLVVHLFHSIFKYALTQVTTEQVIVVDDYCIVAGTDTNFPFTNQFELEESQVPFWQEVTDTRFMVVCFVEPIFNMNYGLFDTPVESSVDTPSSTDTSSSNCQDIADLICSDAEFSILCEFVKAAGLEGALNAGTWTIFGPSNSAFENLGVELPVGKIEDLLTFHAVSGSALAKSDLVCKEVVAMANGKNSRTKCDDSSNPSVFYQTGADNMDDRLPEIVQFDIQACNGVIHEINNIMLPSAFFPDITPNSGN